MTDQPTLPLYKGNKPEAGKTKYAGLTLNRVEREHHLGERFVTIVEWRTEDAAHHNGTDGLTYTEDHKPLNLWELDPDEGARILTYVRGKVNTNEARMTDAGEVGYADANGTVLTEQEVAERQGRDIIDAVTGDAADAVIVYDDQTRSLWPRDFAPDTPRPTFGDKNGDAAEVVEILDAATGEPLEEYGAEVAVAPGPGDDEPPQPVEDDVVAMDDGLEPFDAGLQAHDDVVVELDAHRPITPTADEFVFVDRKISELKADLKDQVERGVTAEQLRRWLAAEQQGRGRGLKARTGILSHLDVLISDAEQREA